MKVKQMLLALMTLPALFLFENCDEDERKGEIKLSVEKDCGGVISFQGDHVFAYRETDSALGFVIDQLVVGGYEKGDTRELGIFLSWPPNTGTYDLSATTAASLYYDPMNTEPEDPTDQYEALTEGLVTVVSVTTDGSEVTQIHLTFSGIKVLHPPSGDTLCLDNGLIKIE